MLLRLDVVMNHGHNCIVSLVQVKNSVNLLKTIGALDDSEELTHLGKL